MNVRWITHKGRALIRVDFNLCKSQDEMMATLNDYWKVLRESREQAYIFMNFEGITPELNFLTKIRELTKELGAKALKSALIGVTGVKKTYLTTYLIISRQKNVAPFDTEQEALDWLAT